MAAAIFVIAVILGTASSVQTPVIGDCKQSVVFTQIGTELNITREVTTCKE